MVVNIDDEVTLGVGDSESSEANLYASNKEVGNVPPSLAPFSIANLHLPYVPLSLFKKSAACCSGSGVSNARDSKDLKYISNLSLNEVSDSDLHCLNIAYHILALDSSTIFNPVEHLVWMCSIASHKVNGS